MDLQRGWANYLRRISCAAAGDTDSAACTPPSSNVERAPSRQKRCSPGQDCSTREASSRLPPPRSERPRAHVDDDDGDADDSYSGIDLRRGYQKSSSLPQDASPGSSPPCRQSLKALPCDNSSDFSRLKQKGKLWTPEDGMSSSRATFDLSNRLGGKWPVPSFARRGSSLVEDESILREIKQPECRPISQDQLVAEVKGIYAGLVMIESKCIEVCSSQNAQYDLANKNWNNKQWQSLITLHRKLLQEHHDHFLASQAPSASPALRRLASKYGLTSGIFSSSILWNNTPRRLNGRRPPWDIQYLPQFLYYSNRLMALFASKALLLEGAEGELLRILKKVEKVFRRLRNQFNARYAQQLLAYIFLFFYGFSELFKGMRPLCTTMPWTIWPSLVVLWGVCWMFPCFGPEVSGMPEQQAPETDDHLGLSMYISAPTLAESDLFSIWGDFSSHVDGYEAVNASLPADIEPSHSPSLILDAYAAAQPQTTITPFSQLTGSGRVSANNALVPTTLLCLENKPQKLSESTERVGSAATTANITRAVQRRTLKCSDCGKVYARLDSLQRHRREVHGGHNGNKEVFFCPYSQCPKGATGVGFKRQDKLDYHLRRTCKVRFPVPALDHDGTLPTPTPPSTKEVSDTNSLNRSRSPTRETDHAAEPEIEVLGDKSVISTLKRLRSVAATKLEKLQAEIASYDLIIAKLEGA